ncbi:MAG: prolyl oligopeptidase family serine peptidase [Verrucomicrobiota bacterium]
MRTRAIGLALVMGLMAGDLSARTWTSTDGKTIEAEFVGATDTEVTIMRADGKEFTMPLTRLSDDDRAWINENKDELMKAAEAANAEPIEGAFANLVTGEFELSTHGDLPFAFYGSPDLDGAKKYPLLLVLHGKSSNNENGKQAGMARRFTQAAVQDQYPCFVVAPLCYQPYGATGGGWNDKPGEEAISLVEALIGGLPVDETRIYVTGNSMGGFGTCHLMAEAPKLFTAGVAVAGYGHSGNAGDLKREPLRLYHAVDDPVVGVEGARSFAEALERSDTFLYTEYPDGGHGIYGRVFEDPATLEWLFGQVEG